MTLNPGQVAWKNSPATGSVVSYLLRSLWALVPNHHYTHFFLFFLYYTNIKTLLSTGEGEKDVEYKNNPLLT